MHCIEEFLAFSFDLMNEGTASKNYVFAIIGVETNTGGAQLGAQLALNTHLVCGKTAAIILYSSALSKLKSHNQTGIY